MEAFPAIASKHYNAIRDEIRSGDLLLCSGHSTFSTLIQKTTRSIWSHVGFILRVDPIDRIMVLESVESIGVRSIPLSNYAKDYNGTGKPYPGTIMIARHQDVNPHEITHLSQKAVDLLGYPYGTDEIIRIAARISLYSLDLPEPRDETDKPMHEYICSEYVHECFKSMGIHVNHNPMGFIAPADFARDTAIKPLFYLEPETEATALAHAS